MNEIEINLKYLPNKFVKSINKKAPICNECRAKSLLKRAIAEQGASPTCNEQIYDDKHIFFLFLNAMFAKKK